MANLLDIEAMDPISKALAQSRESSLSQLARQQALNRRSTATRQASFNQFGSPILENLQGRQEESESAALNQLLGLLAQQEIGARQTQEQIELQKAENAREQFLLDQSLRGDPDAARRRRLSKRGKIAGTAAGVGLAALAAALTGGASVPLTAGIGGVTSAGAAGAAGAGGLSLNTALLAGLLGGGAGETFGGFW